MGGRCDYLFILTPIPRNSRNIVGSTPKEKAVKKGPEGPLDHLV